MSNIRFLANIYKSAQKGNFITCVIKSWWPYWWHLNFWPFKPTKHFQLFVGFDYECQRGHRFMVQNPGKALRHRRTNGTLTLDAASLMSSAQPMWMACTCKREPKQIAQLMHIHVVTPKAPVTVTLSPKVRMEACPEGYFHPGTENEVVDLGRAKYYVLRWVMWMSWNSGTF